MRLVIQVLLTLLLFTPMPSLSQESRTWQLEYQQLWYPSDPELRNGVENYLQQKFPDVNFEALEFLPKHEQQQLLYASIIYLRYWQQSDYHNDVQHFAQLVVELGLRLKLPLATAEGYYFHAANRVHQRSDPAVIEQALGQAEQVLADHTNPVSYSQKQSKLLKLRILIIKGWMHLIRRNFAQMSSAIEQAVQQSQALQDPAHSLRVWYLKSVSHYKLFQTELALEALFKAEQLNNQLPAPPLTAQLSHYLGLTYLQQGETDEAIHYLQQASDSFRAQNMLRQHARTLRNLGSIYLSLEKNHEAIATQLNALASEEHSGNRYGIGRTQLQLAEAYLAAGELQQAQSSLNKARAIFNENRQNAGKIDLLRAQLLEARLLSLDGSPEAIKTATTLAKKTQKQLQKASNAPLLNEVNRLLAQLYIMKGEHQEAIALLHHESEALRDRLSAAMGWRIAHIEEKYLSQELREKLKKQQLELQHVTKTNQRYQHYAIWFFTAGIVVTLIAIGLKYRLKMAHIKRLKAEHLARVCPATGIANEREMYDLFLQEINRIQAQQESWYTSGSNAEAPDGKLLMLMKIPALSNIAETLGMEAGRKLQKKLGHFLKNEFADVGLFQPMDDMIALILPGHQPKLMANRIFSVMERFQRTKEVELGHLSVGMIYYPFVGRACKSTGMIVVHELLLVALAAASKLSQRHQQHCWVALEAIDAIPLTLFNNNIRDNILLAIHKGYIRVLSQHDKTTIEWPSPATVQAQA